MLNSINFAFEETNVANDIDLEYLKRNKKFKMSATETLFFTRYFGLLLGDRVPRNDVAWKLYIILRSIINIITSPTINVSDLM